MKKQSRDSNYRQTPPFVQFQTIRQRLRISLPQQQVHNIIGLRDMERINNSEPNQINLAQLLGYANRKTQTKKDKKKSKPKMKTKKKTQRQRGHLYGIEEPQHKSKATEYNNLTNFSQCLYPVTDDLKKIYNIHSQRPKNNRSNNLEQRERAQTHRRGYSEVLQVHKSSKPVPSKKASLKPKEITRRNQRNFVEQICNQTLDCIPWSRMQSEASENETMNSQHNKFVLQELYNSSDSEGLDSEDEHLVTMVSQDMQSIRDQKYSSGKKIEKEKKLNFEKNQIKSKVQIENIVSQEIEIKEQGHKSLEMAIDFILDQIQSLKKKQVAQKKESKVKEENKIEQIEQTRDSGGWAKQPTLLQLQIILQNCLNHGQFQLATGRVVHNFKEKEIQSKKMDRSTLYEDKWKQAQVKRITKAQKLLKEGYVQANRILNSPIKYGEDKPSKYGEKRLKANSNSMSFLIFNAQPKKIQRKIDLKPQEQLFIKERSEADSIINEVIIKNQKKDQNDHERKRKLLKMKEETGQIEEIIQIMILDLCIQIIEDVEIGFSNPANLFENLYLSLSKKRTKKRLGFSTSPSEIYTFLQKFSRFLQETKDGQSNLTYKQLINKRIQEPIGPKPLELLKFMREATQLSNQASPEEPMEEMLEEKETFALSLPWFHEFSQKYIKEYNFGVYYENDQERETKRKLFLKNAMHVHNKCIFDSINETIDKHRPYGILGEPFPWKDYNKPSAITPLKFNGILNSTFEQVSEHSRYLCGIFSQQHITYKLSQLQFLEFTQDRLNKMLCKHIIENESRWTFIDDEETEIMVELGRFIFVGLMMEMAKEIQEIDSPKGDGQQLSRC